MELDPGAWVVHRHVIDACLDELDPRPSWPASAPTQPNAYDPARLPEQFDFLALLASRGHAPSSGGGPSPALCEVTRGTADTRSLRPPERSSASVPRGHVITGRPCDVGTATGDGQAARTE